MLNAGSPIPMIFMLKDAPTGGICILGVFLENSCKCFWRMILTNRIQSDIETYLWIFILRWKWKDNILATNQICKSIIILKVISISVYIICQNFYLKCLFRKELQILLTPTLYMQHYETLPVHTNQSPKIKFWPILP